MRTSAPPANSASTSVWPVAAQPAAARLLLLIGAVTSASAKPPCTRVAAWMIAVYAARPPAAVGLPAILCRLARWLVSRTGTEPPPKGIVSALRFPPVSFRGCHAARLSARPVCAATSRRSARSPTRIISACLRVGRCAAAATATSGPIPPRVAHGNGESRFCGRSLQQLDVVALAKILSQPAGVAFFQRLGVELLADFLAVFVRGGVFEASLRLSSRTMCMPTSLRTGLLYSFTSRVSTASLRASSIVPTRKVPSTPPLSAAGSSEYCRARSPKSLPRSSRA